MRPKPIFLRPYAGLVTLGVSLSCGEQIGIVGSQEGYFTDFAENDGFWIEQKPLAGASIGFGLEDAGATDGRVVELRFPGHPEYAPTDNVGAGFATQIASVETFHFGTFRSRVQFGSCDVSEGVVSAAFGYFGDGSDDNENGITDDLEINFQMVCGTPSYAFLTVFTDYEEAGGTVQFRKLSHVVDFTSGDFYDTPSPTDDAFVLTGNDPVFVRPDLFNSSAFYELGFEWHADSLRFFLVLDGKEETLWELTDTSQIPQRPVYQMYNMWHTDTHWFPASGEASFPAEDLVMRVDWFRYVPESL